jgi:hypothetical protein
LIAAEFHAAYEAAAPVLGYATREESRVPWDKVPEKNKKLMIETARDLLARGIISPGPKLHETVLRRPR